MRMRKPLAGQRLGQQIALTLALLALLGAPIRAEEAPNEARIDRLELLASGFYDTTQANVTGSSPAAGSSAGVVHTLGTIALLPAPPAVSARIGIGFGVRFRSFGENDGASAPLRSVWRIPAPGIHNPNTGNTYRQSVADFTTTIGDTQWRGYGFDDPWEVVPGVWTIEIWQGERKLLEQSFTVTTAEGGGDPAPADHGASPRSGDPTAQ